MGYKIKQIREKLGLTQEALAQASGVGRVTIALIESGTTKNASSKTLIALAKALHTTIDELFLTKLFNRLNT